jgi:hypothetical protein
MNGTVNYRNFLSKLCIQTVYFEYPFEDAYFRSEPGGEYFVKINGQPEFKALKDSKLITDALLEYREITKDQYEAA